MITYMMCKRKQQSSARILTLSVKIWVLVLAFAVTHITIVFADQDTASKMQIVSSQQLAFIASTASKVLRHLAQARQHIRNNEYKEANIELVRAENTITLIKISMPTTRIKNHIWVIKSHLDYESAAEVMQDFSALLLIVDYPVDVVVTEKVKTHLMQAEDLAKRNEFSASKEELKAAADELIYPEIDIPLAEAQRLITMVKSDINKRSDNLKRANRLLAKAEDNMAFLSTLPNSPLPVAKKSIKNASKHYNTREYKVAQQEITIAIMALERVAQSTDAQTRKSAEELLKGAKSLQHDIEKRSQKTTAKLHILWLRTAALNERDIENIGLVWSKAKEKTNLRMQLADAKLFLKYAKIAHLTGNDTKKAFQELKKSRRILEKTMNSMKVEQKARSQSVLSKIDDVMKNIQEKDGKDIIENNYDTLIEEIEILKQQ